MKILRISSLPSISKPGMGLAALRLAQTEGFETTCISYSLVDDEYQEDVKALNLFLFPFNNPVMPKSRAGLPFVISQVRRLLVILRFSFLVLLFIKSNKPDIIHLHSPMHFLIGAWARLIRIPTFLTFHGTDFNRIINSRTYQLCIKPIKHINCVSSHQVSPLKNIFPNTNVRLVSNAVDLDEFTSSGNTNKSNKTLIAVGSLRWQKGFDKLIDTFSEIVNDCKNWNLKIIGDGPDKTKLELKINSLALNTRVELLGAISKSEVANELFKADIFVLSSVTEGLPKALLEAMRARCGCIAFKVGDCERVLLGSGVLIDAEDYAGLRQAMLELIHSSELRQSLGQKSFSRAGEFSWVRYQDLHKQLYSNAFKENRS
jgi:glycosyltransferase involved in cell wall biosynthesis